MLELQVCATILKLLKVFICLFVFYLRSVLTASKAGLKLGAAFPHSLASADDRPYVTPCGLKDAFNWLNSMKHASSMDFLLTVLTSILQESSVSRSSPVITCLQSIMLSCCMVSIELVICVGLLFTF